MGMGLGWGMLRRFAKLALITIDAFDNDMSYVNAHAVSYVNAHAVFCEACLRRVHFSGRGRGCLSSSVALAHIFTKRETKCHAFHVSIRNKNRKQALLF